jgi:NAD(P)-dependent dehydrogenase (short-subunit alcohol dehydrogenase family)
LALYYPAKGYYSGGAQKFGEKGDFITAPETSDLFGFCLARQCAQVLESGVIHYRNSNKEAQTLADELNQLRSNSVTLIQAELSDLQALKTLADTIKQLDVLVNNASLFKGAVRLVLMMVFQSFSLAFCIEVG